ncbi:hypothetical protein [Actinoplanes sp. NPDC051411]|uniref:hypothetical protein n=1 Tax=Actinoplanes sp. NPDC051411 TaxID=3155522 RepID=UPI0034254973
MVGPVPSIAQVPLAEALPPFCSGAEDELRRLSSALEQHRLAAGRTEWHWYPQHSTTPGQPEASHFLIVFDATVTLFSSGTDSLALTIDVAWLGRQLTVNAAVEVACWCADYHGVHHVREGQWLVDSSAAVVAAFAAGTAMLSDVLDSGPYEPGPWRIESHLPDAP